MDFAAASKMSGARFVVLKGRLAKLERAIAQFMLDLHTSEEGGYTEVNPPFLVRDNAAYGVGQLPRFAEDMFHTDNGFWLIPTAEVPLTNLVNDTVLEEKTLPLRYTAWTPCFRSEAGAARQGYARNDPPAPVRQGRAGIDHHARAVGRRAQAYDRPRGRGAEAPRPAVPHHHPVRRRHGPGLAQDLRHRGLAARPECLSRDLELLELRRIPGAPHGRALPAERG